MVKIIDIRLERDLREENVIQKDLDGNPIKFKQSEYVCKIVFDNFSYCVIDFKDLARAMELINQNEDYKYPSGLGRKMPFYAYIYPMYKKLLEERGFSVNLNDLEFSNKMRDKINEQQNI